MLSPVIPAQARILVVSGIADAVGPLDIEAGTGVFSKLSFGKDRQSGNHADPGRHIRSLPA